MKNFKGKAIYQPKGKAAEYAAWACNFYVGCSNGCEYCYCKKGILKGVMGQHKPQLKKGFLDEADAIETFRKEFMKNKYDLREHGLFFSFTTDPMLPQTIKLTKRAVRMCLSHNIPVKILTKCAEWVDEFLLDAAQFISGWPDWVMNTPDFIDKIAFGFTLTGHDEHEPNASTNLERIEAMKKLYNAGFKIFASIEPIIDLSVSFEMISATNGFCDLYKIGLMSGVKIRRNELRLFIKGVIDQVEFYGAKLYFKDSLLKAAGIERSELPLNCVDRDYDMFKQTT